MNKVNINRVNILLVGIGYGDEGKGTLVDYFTRKASQTPVIVRYNGGSQAAHNVVSPEGLNHEFQHFGSGFLAKDTTTYISEFMLFNPISIKDEAEKLFEKTQRHPGVKLFIHEDSLIITPYHKSINQMLEICRGNKRHGSCGKGVGETIKDSTLFGKNVLRAKDLKSRNILEKKVLWLRDLKLKQAEEICAEHCGKNGNTDQNDEVLRKHLSDIANENRLLNLIDIYADFLEVCRAKVVSNTEAKKLLHNAPSLIFEGAQGALLDRQYGFLPHVTKSNTTLENADEILRKYDVPGEVRKIAILRAYTTRHGAGPFVTYDQELSQRIPDMHNTTNNWQGDFRIGWLDLVATRYALKMVGPVDSIALTNIDRLYQIEEVKVCDRYEYVGKEKEKLEMFFEFHTRAKRIIITDIKLPTDPNPERQMQLTRLLNDCRPIYDKVMNRFFWKKDGSMNFVDEYVDVLEEKLNTKITIVSCGPRAQDKIVLSKALAV